MGFMIPGLSFVLAVPFSLWILYAMWIEKGRGKEQVWVGVRLVFTVMSLGSIGFIGLMVAPAAAGMWDNINTNAETWVIALFIGVPLTCMAWERLKEYWG